MDRGKKPLEQVREWTTVYKKPNKGKQINPNQGFTPILTSFYLTKDITFLIQW